MLKVQHVYKPNAAQWEAIQSTARETFLVGGVGMGKSFFLAERLKSALMETNGTRCALYAPTTKMLKNSTWVQIKHAWEGMLGMQEGIHYVYNRNPPKSWGVKPMTLTSHGILSMRNGSYCILDGLFDANKQRGTEFDEIFVDEFWGVDEESRKVLMGRLRGQKYKELNRKHRIWYATTPPEDITLLKNLYETPSADIKFIFGSSYINKDNLDSLYLQSLKNIYDETTYRREVMGELIAYTSNQFFCSFVYDKIVRELQPQYNKILYLSFDFNVSPMTCLAAQYSEGKIHIIKEWYIKNNEVPIGKEPISYICERIKPFAERFPLLEITGDASGRARSAIAKKGDNHYIIIRNNFPKAKFDKVPLHNPEISQSRTFCNSMLERHPSLFIDKACVKLITDLEQVKIKDAAKGDIDKSNPNLTHISDCFRYYLHSFHGDFLRVRRNGINLSRLMD